MEITIQPFTMEDYPAAYALWQVSEGIGLSEADSPARIGEYLQRNPGCSFVAWQGEQLAGAVLSGHDGRRGFIHHLAVRESFRHQGIGQALVKTCLQALSERGIDKVHIFVYRDNQAGQAFWEKTGWTKRDTLLIMSKDIQPK